MSLKILSLASKYVTHTPFKLEFSLAGIYNLLNFITRGQYVQNYT